MDAVARQFLGLFQDFLQLCQLDDWPDNDTPESEIRNAFLTSQHIEKSLDKLQRRSTINEFLSILNNANDTSNVLLKHCFTDPPKYVLKKIINSKTKIVQIDVGFTIFLEIFPEDRLEKCLTELMLEAASKETLLRTLPEIPRDKILQFKSNILLNELNNCEDPKEAVINMIDGCTQDIVDLLVISLLNKDFKYLIAVNKLAKTLMLVMSKRNHTYQKFWKYMFKVDEQYLIQLCLDHRDLCKMIFRGLLDCGKLLKENMSAEFFYIDLTYSELVGIVQRISKDECLRAEFEDNVRSSNNECEFWENILTS
ncbi:ubiquitin-fold modifier 1 isoform X1 [Choristoneura fumiferana]|uniref:ubiquitin-fold modifier 1 isoform X1 n=1 Tax=Choristoneura fumiferana TaxID=7141 RepID=UPI003D1565BE